MSPELTIEVRFHPPPDDLRRYFTTFYIANFSLPDGRTVEDSLQPEWANLRFFNGAVPDSWIDPDEVLTNARFTATGPSSRACHFRIGRSRFWGIGLLPLGWSRFVRKPAGDHANLITDGNLHPTFARFRELGDKLFGSRPNEAAELDRIVHFFRRLREDEADDDPRILAIHASLIDPAVDTVAKLVSQVGVGQRTIERTCQSAFGFSPKVLLRRQRFMRSLSQFMLDPSLRWIGAIDGQYHDQAQFVRDFHDFMGTTPRDYAATPHPVLDMFMRERARMHGTAVQTLDSPDGAGSEPA